MIRWDGARKQGHSESPMIVSKCDRKEVSVWLEVQTSQHERRHTLLRADTSYSSTIEIA